MKAVKVVRVDLATGECSPLPYGDAGQDYVMHALMREGWEFQSSQISADGAFALLTFTHDSDD